MPGDGSLYFFTTTRISDPVATFHKIVQTLGATGCRSCSRFTDRRWEMLEAFRNGRRRRWLCLQRRDNADREWFDDPGSWSDISKRFHPKKCVHVCIWHKHCPLLEVMNASSRTIPVELRGDSELATDLFIAVGPHDILEGVEHPDGHLFGRSTFAINFGGSQTPNNWVATRAAVLDLPIVKETQAKLSTILPDLQTCVFWDI